MSYWSGKLVSSITFHLSFFYVSVKSCSVVPFLYLFRFNIIEASPCRRPPLLLIYSAPAFLCGELVNVPNKLSSFRQQTAIILGLFCSWKIYNISKSFNVTTSLTVCFSLAPVVCFARFLIASHTTDYQHPMLFFNTVAVVVLVVAKFPNMHKVRIFGINGDQWE